MYYRLCLIFMILVIGLVSFAQAEQADSLLSNGNFETSSSEDAAAGPTDWPMPENVSWLEEKGNHFLRLEADPETMLTVYRVVPVKPEHEAYAFTFRVRVNSLKRGKANWHDARIILDFKNDAGKKLKPGPPHPNFKGSSDGWVEKRVSFLVPEGATKLEVMPAIFKAASGSIDVDDLALTPTDPQPIIERREKAVAKREEQIRRKASKVKPQVPVVAADKLPPMLRVNGNEIETVNGETIWLQGVAIPSMEWTAAGEQILESVRVAIDQWNANVIRLPIKEHFWAGKGPYQNDGGAFYRQLVDDVVNLAAADGVYTVIDLHRFRAPKSEHARFWTEVAEKYKDHPAVLFELFNEPHDVSWEVWRNGGFVSTEKKQDTDAVAENQQKLEGYESIGMQGLIDAVRDTGAKNIVIVGGLDWGYDLAGVLNGYALDDRGGNGIVYSSHVYPWKSDWQGKFLDVAAEHPIFIGECGAPEKRLEFIPPEQHEAPATWVPDFLGLVQKHKLHWTAWSFHPRASPVLLKDWSYEPNDYWGQPAKEALNGKQVELKRLR